MQLSRFNWKNIWSSIRKQSLKEYSIKIPNLSITRKTSIVRLIIIVTNSNIIILKSNKKFRSASEKFIRWSSIKLWINKAVKDRTWIV